MVEYERDRNSGEREMKMSQKRDRGGDSKGREGKKPIGQSISYNMI